MTTESPFVTVEEVASTPGPTYGLTEKQVRFDVRNGYLPGTIDYRKRVVIRRGEWNDFLTGDWAPAEPGSHKKGGEEARIDQAGRHRLYSIEGELAT